MSQTARMTLVQLPERPDPAEKLASFKAGFAAAKAAGSDLIAFPEYCLGRMIPRTHDTVRAFAQLAAEHRMYAVAGLIEALPAGRHTTTALLFGRDGQIVGDYRKVHPAAGIGPYWWPPLPGADAEAMGELGDRFVSFTLDFGTVGIIQCYDGLFPESWGCTAAAGAEIILWINGRSSMLQDSMALAAAQSYAVIVGSNVSDGYNTGFAEPLYGEYLDGIASPGATTQREESRMYPRLPERGEGVVHAALHLDRLRALRKHHRMAHQRRPELYHPLTQPLRYAQQYPDLPWVHPDCPRYVNLASVRALHKGNIATDEHG